LGATEAAAGTVLAGGVHAELRTPVWLVGGAALAGAVLAAALATPRTVRASVLALLRRVPPRAPWRAAVAEAATGALAVAALYQIIVAGDRESPIAYAAPPLLALVAGLLAARALGWWARARTRTAGAASDVPALLAAAQVSRRPAVARVVALLAVAVALLTFATGIWDVAGVNREIAVRASTGADRVYTVMARDPQHLLEAVRAADPTGRQAMAVAWTAERYEGRDLLVAGVDGSRLGAVTDWPDLSRERTAAIGSELAVRPTGPVLLRGPTIEVEATVTRLVQQHPGRLAVVVAVAGRAQAVRLPPMQVGSHTYRAQLGDCPNGCRLLGLRVVRAAAEVATTSVQLTVTGIRDGGRSIDARLGADGGWRVPSQLPVGQSVRLAPAGQHLSITATTDTADVTVDYADYPAATPIVVAGRQPSPEPDAGQFFFSGLGSTPSQMRVVDRELALPGVGSPAVLFDMNTELRQAERSRPIDPTSLRYEVWTAPGASPDLPARLTAAGLQVTDQITQAQRRAELGRLAPGLALRLYLLAGAVAALLAAGVLLLTARVGARARIAELTALRVVGVPGRTLRAAVLREYLMVLVAPLVIGTAAGIGGAILLLPAIPLVTVGPGGIEPVFRAGPWWVPGALLTLVASLALAVGSVLRMVRRAEPRRVQEGEIP
ncbi:MAG TPA: ABC transporter permease, partial [Micromonosporaceae bacterium]|nr:ABC transporter permease [Micromonosporaceae bacterium]